MSDIKINAASFEEAFTLKSAVLSVVSRNGFKLSDLMKDDNLDVLVTMALAVDTDKDVYDALWPCLARCTYKGEKITKNTFEDVAAREHYMPIVTKCIEENLSPFIVGLRSVCSMFQRAE